MGGIRGETTQNNVIFEIILQYFDGFVRPEAVVNQYSWFFVSTLLGFEVKDTLKPLQADLKVGISRFKVRILLSEGKEGYPVTSIDGSWPDDYGV
jgi:hypothetical protein